jgi:hypothetical protein
MALLRLKETMNLIIRVVGAEGYAQQMMHGIAIDSQSPLYGRSDEILRIRPMEMAVLSDYLGTNPMEAVEEYKADPLFLIIEQLGLQDMVEGSESVGLEIEAGVKMEGMFVVANGNLIAVAVFGVGNPVVAEHGTPVTQEQPQLFTGYAQEPE